MTSKKTSKNTLISHGVVANNKRARYDYEITDEVEAGLILTGTEVKSMRNGKAQINEAYVGEKDGGLWLLGGAIAQYPGGNRENHEEKRPRKCLLHKKQEKKLMGEIAKKGITLVPMKLYFNERGLAKLLIGLGKGKKEFEKRATIKKRDWDKQKSRIMKDHG
ncbi:MAG: SsrA-binding protein SmpB [Rickettsiales bacterium]|nr:SsrA-binding protein SmpB [Rickettsiales bacterium]